MGDNRFPKQLLFGELLTVRSSHGPRLHWRDVVLRDIQRLGLDALNCYDVAQNWSRWHDLYTTTVFCLEEFLGVRTSVITGSFVCDCGRTFGRSGNLTKHGKYCTGQPPPFKQSSTVSVAEFSGVKVISYGTSTTVQLRLYQVQFLGSRTLLLSTRQAIKVCVCM